MAVGAIIFDLDNTIVDDDYATRMGVIGFHKVFGCKLGWAPDELTDHWYRVLEIYYAQFLTGAISLQESRRRRIYDLFRMKGHEVNADEADAAFAVYRAEYAKSWRLFDDVLPALEKLAGRRKAILTNGSLESQSEKLTAVGVSHLFEALYASADLGVAKPSPQVFWKVCAGMGIQPTACVHVGDRLDTDARGAKEAGLRSIWLNRRGAAIESFGGETISTLAELPSLL